MRERHLHLLLAVMSFVVLLLFTGCSQKSPYGQDVGELQNKHEDLPKWVLSDSDDYSAVGSASYKGQSYIHQRNEAVATARMNLVNKIEIKVDSLTRVFYQATGQGSNLSEKNLATIDEVSKQVTSQVSSLYLRGSKAVDTYIADDGEMFVKVEVDPNINLSILENMKSNPILRQQKNADEGFKELETEVKKLEKERS